jgi:hypothetical protein
MLSKAEAALACAVDASAAGAEAWPFLPFPLLAAAFLAVGFAAAGFLLLRSFFSVSAFAAVFLTGLFVILRAVDLTGFEAAFLVAVGIPSSWDTFNADSSSASCAQEGAGQRPRNL